MKSGKNIGFIIGIVSIVVGTFAGITLLKQQPARVMDAEIEHEEKYIEPFLQESDAGAYAIQVDDTEMYANGQIETYLFMGTDMSGNENGNGADYQGAMADVLMLIVLDDQTRSYGVLQLNRDTITEVPLMQQDGSAYASAQLQLCTAHWYGGNKEQSCENTLQAVSDLLGGIAIDGYYAVSMEAMQILNHAVGGVQVVLEDDMTGFDPAMKKGEHIKLSDEQAQILLQSRYGMADDRNIERMRRQRLFLTSFMKEFQEKSRSDKNFVIDLYSSLRVYATDNLNINEIINICSRMQSYTSMGIKTIEGETLLGDRLEDGQQHWEFYMDQSSFVETLQSLGLLGKG